MHHISPMYMYGGSLVSYLLVTVALYLIAQRLGHDLPWLAFVPLANLWLILNLGGESALWLILFFIPCINLIFFVVLLIAWAHIARSLGKSELLAIALLIPIVNVIVLYYLALSGPSPGYA